MSVENGPVGNQRTGLIKAVAQKYHVLIDPELLVVLLSFTRDPVEAVDEVVWSMRPGEVVLTFNHFEVG